MSHKQRISVLIATHNRANILGETLDAIAGVRSDDVEYEVIVIDNNSTDKTRQVVEERVELLPLLYLFEETPGKNAALNAAIERYDLGEIVVFTDDDVVPQHDWFDVILESTQHRSEYDVFGGRVDLLWPDGEVPWWARKLSEEGWAFARQDLGPASVEYPISRTPCGPNFWIRRSLLDSGYRFDENIGPRPKDRIMGGESTFLFTLYRDGYRALFIPDSIVGHRVLPHLLDKKGMRKRAVTNGRGGAIQRVRFSDVTGISNPLRRPSAHVFAAVKRLLVIAVSYIPVRSGDVRFLQRIESLRGFAWHKESIRLARMTSEIGKPE